MILDAPPLQSLGEIDQRTKQGVDHRQKDRQFDQRPDEAPSSEPSSQLHGNPAAPVAQFAFGGPDGHRLAPAIEARIAFPTHNGFFAGAPAATRPARLRIGAQLPPGPTAPSACHFDPLANLGFTGSPTEAAGAIGTVADAAGSPAGRTLHQ